MPINHTTLLNFATPAFASTAFVLNQALNVTATEDGAPANAGHSATAMGDVCRPSRSAWVPTHTDVCSSCNQGQVRLRSKR
jgi:hypothetical protein